MVGTAHADGRAVDVVELEIGTVHLEVARGNGGRPARIEVPVPPAPANCINPGFHRIARKRVRGVEDFVKSEVLRAADIPAAVSS